MIKIQPDEIVGAEFEPVMVLGNKDLREPIVVKRSQYKGKRRVSIRAHYIKEGVLNPGRRGIEIPEEYLGVLIESLQIIAASIDGSEV